jgi:hypothetical protein
MDARPTAYGGLPGERGSALFITLVTTAIIAGMVVSLFGTALSESRAFDYRAREARAAYLAEGGAEIAERAILTALANHAAVPASGAATIAGNAVEYTISFVTARPPVNDGGVVTFIDQYHIVSTATFEDVTVRVHKLVDASQTAVFQFAVFYQGTLELLPGPSMTLTGRVHTNEDLHIGTGGTLTVDAEYLRAAGRVYRQRLNDGSRSTGTVRVKVKGTGEYASLDSWYQLDAQGIPSPHGLDSDFRGHDADASGVLGDDPDDLYAYTQEVLERFKGALLSAEHGVTPLEPPEVGSIDEGGYYHRNASLVVKSDGSDITVFGPGGSELPLDAFPAGTFTEARMYDGRENQEVSVVDVDVEKLNQSGLFPSNGLLYAYRTDASPERPSGVRLKNARELGGDLSVVSPTPVYVWGDYNTTSKKRASIITDAVNLLSNAWDGGKSRGRLPKASPTTYNTAIVSGNLVTNSGGSDPDGLDYRYNGGFENMPRFHENWTGVDCMIRGSFVSLWESRVGTGAWRYGGDNYTAPNRLWDFDVDFNDPSNLPPWTPRVVGTSQVVWWME